MIITEQQEKISATFGHLVVNKQDALKIKSNGSLGLPGYVVDFFLGHARKNNADISVEQIYSKIRKNLVEPDQTNQFLGKLMQKGNAKITSALFAKANPAKQEFLGEIIPFSQSFLVQDGLVRKYPEILSSGLWGTVSLSYNTSEKKPVIIVDGFTPYQLANPDISLFKEARKDFSTINWISLLISSLGLKAEKLTRRQQLLLLTRLVPLVQANCNLIELGPRGTGKSFTLTDLSHQAYLLAGAKVTAASLLYNAQSRTPGSLMRKKALIFDEIGNTTFPDLALVASLKDYMESGRITRMGSGKTFHSNCSLMFVGNLDMNSTGQAPAEKYKHYFEVLPRELQDTAFMDRFHGFIPGWEMPKIKEEILSDSLGLLSDYFSAVLSETDKNSVSLRKDASFDSWLSQHIKLEASTSEVTLRDQKAIFKIAGGLMKLIFPDGNFPMEDMTPIINLSIELRQLVLTQMNKLAPGEFPMKIISWEYVE